MAALLLLALVFLAAEAWVLLSIIALESLEPARQ